VKALLRGAVPRDGLLITRGHCLLRGTQVSNHDIESATGEHPIAGKHVEVAGTRILGQVADAAAAVDGAGGGKGVAGEHAGKGRLAGTVSPDKSDPVARTDPEVGSLEQQACTSTQLDTGGGEHRNSKWIDEGRCARSSARLNPSSARPQVYGERRNRRVIDL